MERHGHGQIQAEKHHEDTFRVPGVQNLEPPEEKSEVKPSELTHSVFQGLTNNCFGNDKRYQLDATIVICIYDARSHIHQTFLVLFPLRISRTRIHVTFVFTAAPK
jgi:hypothetical protein